LQDRQFNASRFVIVAYEQVRAGQSGIVPCLTAQSLDAALFTPLVRVQLAEHNVAVLRLNDE
jgi:hypothetical protein